MTQAPARLLDADAAAAVLRGVLGGQVADLTIADAAARSGLSLRDAETGMHRLLLVHRGHLSVTDKGELLFRFPQGVALTQKSELRAVGLWLGRAALTAVRWLLRLGLTIFLVGYSLFFTLVIVLMLLAISAIAGGDFDVGDGIGHVFGGLGDAIFWCFHPIWDPSEESGRQPHPFYAKVNGFFFGPPRPRDDQRAPIRALVAEIRQGRGRIAIGDVVRVTGATPERASALVSRLLVDYEGHIDVTEDGVILYRFPGLRPSAEPAEGVPAPPSIWKQALDVPAFTGNSLRDNLWIVMLLGFVALLAHAGMSLGLWIWVADVPFWASVCFAALVPLRLPGYLRRRRSAIGERGRRALLQLAHASACERKGLEEAEVAAAWRTAGGGRLTGPRLQRALSEIGGELEIDGEGRCLWRFPTIEREIAALALARAQARDDEREVGTVEFSSLPGPEGQAPTASSATMREIT